MAEISQSSRQLLILEILNESKEGLTVQELHNEIQIVDQEISERTIRRDIEQLSLDNAIEEIKNGKSYRYKLERFNLKSMDISLKEIYALKLIQIFMLEQSNDYIYDQGNKVIEHILSNTTNIKKTLFDNLDNILIIRQSFSSDQEIDMEIGNTILNSISNKKVIKILYYSFYNNKIEERKIDPYHLFLQEGKLHLVAFCRLRNEIRDFRVSRIKEAEGLKEKFIIKEELLEKVSQKRFVNIIGKEVYDVKIKFTKEMARYIKEYEEYKSD